MASRRMVSNKIIDSARFIKMPISSQCLYFHLIAKGDDDGVVEAFNVMRMIGASEDDLKVLVSKGFVTVLNEDLVSYITDWKEHNMVRADRKVDSIYKDLLLHIVPEVELLEAKPTYYSKKKELPDICQTNDSIGKDSIGEDREGKNSIDIYSPAKAEQHIPYIEIIDYLNERTGSNYRHTTKKTKDLIKARFNEGFTLEDFKVVIDKKCVEWINDEKMNKFLRPETLFGTKFESYLNQVVHQKKVTTKDLTIDISDF
jgi:uncharacterized phage protein (TIGR02220 family)